MCVWTGGLCPSFSFAKGLKPLEGSGASGIMPFYIVHAGGYGD